MMSTVASPPSGSPIRNSDSSFDLKNRLIFEEKKNLTSCALDDLQRMESLLKGVDVSSLAVLRNELESLKRFYTFLTTTGNFVETDERGYFSVLPPELLHQIFSLLDHKSLLNMSQVCKRFKEMEEQDHFWEGICMRNPVLSQSEKPRGKNWKWQALSKLREWKEKDLKNGPGTYYYPPSVGDARHGNERNNGGEEGNNGANSMSRDSYFGDWLDNNRHGFGVYTWTAGSSYAGEWKDDQRFGFGVRMWPNGNKYVGEYKNHKRHGNGEFTFTNGSVFRGQFNENKFTQGTYTWPNGRVYTGQWNNVFRHGNGHYSWPDGRTYHGEWRRDKRHGEGVYTWKEGDQFLGHFVDGKRVGEGILRLTNGDIYAQIWKEERFDEFFRGANASPEVVTRKVEKNSDEYQSCINKIETKLESLKQKMEQNLLESTLGESNESNLRKKRKIESLKSQPVISEGEEEEGEFEDEMEETDEGQEVSEENNEEEDSATFVSNNEDNNNNNNATNVPMELSPETDGPSPPKRSK